MDGSSRADKGKIERFLRRVRDQFLIRNHDLSSISELNRQFIVNRVLLPPHRQAHVELTDV